MKASRNKSAFFLEPQISGQKPIGETSVGFKVGQQNGLLCSLETVQHYHGSLIRGAQNHKDLKLDWTMEEY